MHIERLFLAKFFGVFQYEFAPISEAFSGILRISQLIFLYNVRSFDVRDNTSVARTAKSSSYNIDHTLYSDSLSKGKI